MSKAFTKDDAPEAPLVVPRAPLPPGVPNYVTKRGLGLLRAELSELEAERVRLAAVRDDDPERLRRVAVVAGRMSELTARIASAQAVDPRAQPHDQVRFGATVTVCTHGGERDGEERRLTIVGVDEAEPAARRIAFLAPIARAILGLGVGDRATLRTAGGEETLEIVAIEYDSV